MTYLVLCVLSFIAGALMMYFAYPVGGYENVPGMRTILEEDRRIERRNALLKEIEHQIPETNPIQKPKIV